MQKKGRKSEADCAGRRKEKEIPTYLPPMTDDCAHGDGLTEEQREVASTAHAMSSVYVVIAPAGCGKSTVANRIALARIALGLRGHVVYSYNATGHAMRAPFAASLRTGKLTHGTFHKFASMVTGRCHVDGPVPLLSDSDVDTALQSLCADTFLLESMHALKGVLVYRPKGIPPVRQTTTVGHLGDLANGVAPPECVTWTGMAVRWRLHHSATFCNPAAWAVYADSCLSRLGLHGDRRAAEASVIAPRVFKGVPRPDLLSPYDFVRTWRAYTMVRQRWYDAYLNAHRLELAWFPERFDLVRAAGLLDFLIVDEAQDVPGAESAYLPRCMAAWNVEAWFAGDPNQELYTFMGTVNMLRTMEGITRAFVLSTNFRVPTPVWAAANAHVCDLPHATLVRSEGSVQYVAVAPPPSGVQGAVLLFRGNRALVKYGAEYMVAMGHPARVSRHFLARCMSAWRLWKSGVVHAGGPGAHQGDDDSDDFCAFEQAFRNGIGKAGAVMQTPPSLWLQEEAEESEGSADAGACGGLHGSSHGCAVEDFDDVAASVDSQATTYISGEEEAGVPPLLSTVHGFKGQGHHDIVLMPGIVTNRKKRHSVETPEGRLVYTAITRCSRRLRIVAPVCSDGADGTPTK